MDTSAHPGRTSQFRVTVCFREKQTLKSGVAPQNDVTNAMAQIERYTIGRVHSEPAQLKPKPKESETRLRAKFQAGLQDSRTEEVRVPSL